MKEVIILEIIKNKIKNREIRGGIVYHMYNMEF
jgi:hypothetical protein